MPLATFVRRFAKMKLEPADIADDPELRIATSLIDYISRRLALDFLPMEERAELGILSTQERTRPTCPAWRRWRRLRWARRRRPRRRHGGGDQRDAGGNGSRTRRSGSTAALLRLRRHHAAGRRVLRVRSCGSTSGCSQVDGHCGPPSESRPLSGAPSRSVGPETAASKLCRPGDAVVE